MLDPFRLCLALGPVVIYLLLLVGINLLRRPLLVSGTRDAAVLGLALSGMVLVGPMTLFLPVSTLIAFRSLVWVLLVGLYGTCLLMVLLVMRPRLVIYNISVEELRPVLASVAAELDSEARWAGDSGALPHLGVQFFLDIVPGMRNISLIAAGPRQSLAGWRRLEEGLAAALAQVEVKRNSRALHLLTAAAVLGVLLVANIARDPQSVAESLYGVMQATVEIGRTMVHGLPPR